MRPKITWIKNCQLLSRRDIISYESGKKIDSMIDALFGSKTRVKLLHLFMNNPGQSFYVREITRKIDEQINSVRRELANMIGVGVVTSDSSDNKLFYQVNQRYEYYLPLKAIFSDSKEILTSASATPVDNGPMDQYSRMIKSISGIRLAVLAGVLVKGSSSPVDALIVGTVSPQKIRAVMSELEKSEGRELNYSVMEYDEFYYRLSVRDKFISQILSNKHKVVIDKENILVKSEGGDK